MKKRIILLIFAVFLFSLFVLMRNTAVRILIAITFTLAVYLKASERAYRKYKTAKFPGTVGTTMRNYDNMVLGKAAVGKNCRQRLKLTGESLDLTAIGRNFYTDKLILERYFSFLKPGGEAVFCMDCGDTAYFDDKYISRFDAIGLHEVTLWENGIDVRSGEFEKSERINSWLFLISRLLMRIGRIKAVYDLPVTEMAEIKKFCDVRNFQVQFILYHADHTNKKEIPVGLCDNITTIS